jgi:sulfate permease, SulP family
VEQGIILAIILSMVAHLRHSYRPYDRLLVPGPTRVWKATRLEDGAQAAPGLLIYRFGASLYYANASRFAQEVIDLLNQAKAPVKWFCLAAETLDDLDFTGSAVLKRVLEGLKEQGITFVICDLQEPVRAEFRRDGLLDMVGRDCVFGDTDDVLDAYSAQAKMREPITEKGD